MDDTTDATRPSHDTTVDVATAAERLGISEDAVRARIRRGKLQGEKVGAVWRVRLSPGDTSHDTTADRATRHDRRATDATDTAIDTPLVEQLRSENTYLREQLSATLQQLAAERERSDVLQREALGRIEALSASVSGETDDQEAAHHDVENVQQEGIWARLVRWWRG